MNCGKDKEDWIVWLPVRRPAFPGESDPDTSAERWMWLPGIANLRIGRLLLHPKRIPKQLWIWYDVTNIQPIPEYRSFAAKSKRRRVAAVQSQALPDEMQIPEINQLAWIIHKKWMKDENMLKKKDFDDAAVVAALRRGHRQRLYFEQIAVFRHKFMNYSG